MFAVLITVYKNDKPGLFYDALYSISKGQTLKPSQIILVCDGPLTPEIEGIISNFKDDLPYLKVIELETNVGQGNALNEGIKHCDFEYIARMDSDDISLPERFETQMGFLVKNKKIDILSSTILEFNSAGSEYYRILPENHDQIIKLLKFRSPVNHGCCIYRKSAVLDAGGYNGLYQCQDYALWINMAKNGAIFHNINECHMRVRMDDYSKKVGFAYAKEELVIQNLLRSSKLLGPFEFIRNLFVKVLGRLLPLSLVTIIYEKIYRK